MQTYNKRDFTKSAIGMILIGIMSACMLLSSFLLDNTPIISKFVSIAIHLFAIVLGCGIVIANSKYTNFKVKHESVFSSLRGFFTTFAGFFLIIPETLKVIFIVFGEAIVNGLAYMYAVDYVTNRAALTHRFDLPFDSIVKQYESLYAQEFNIQLKNLTSYIDFSIQIGFLFFGLLQIVWGIIHIVSRRSTRYSQLSLTVGLLFCISGVFTALAWDLGVLLSSAVGIAAAITLLIQNRVTYTERDLPEI